MERGIPAATGHWVIAFKWLGSKVLSCCTWEAGQARCAPEYPSHELLIATASAMKGVHSPERVTAEIPDATMPAKAMIEAEDEECRHADQQAAFCTSLSQCRQAEPFVCPGSSKGLKLAHSEDWDAVIIWNRQQTTRPTCEAGCMEGS